MSELIEDLRQQWGNATTGESYEAFLESRVEKLDAECEVASGKLSDVWIHLDSWARGEAPSLEFVQEAAESILRHQQCPGWKEEG